MSANLPVSRVILEGAPENWRLVIQILEELMNVNPNVLRSSRDNLFSVILFHVNGHKYIATCIRENYVHICPLLVVNHFLGEVAINYGGELNTKISIPVSVIQKVKQLSSRPTLVKNILWVPEEYLLHRINRGPNEGKVSVQKVKMLKFHADLDMKKAVKEILFKQIIYKPRQIDYHEESFIQTILYELDRNIVEDNCLFVICLNCYLISISAPITLVRTSFNNAENNEEDNNAQTDIIDAAILSHLLQAIERNRMTHSNEYPISQKGKFELYCIDHTFYLVSYCERDFLRINLLDIVGQFDCVDTASPLSCPNFAELDLNIPRNQLRHISNDIYIIMCSSSGQRTTVRSLSSMPAKELLSLVSGIALIEPPKLTSSRNQGIMEMRKVIAFYLKMRENHSEHTSIENSVQLELISRLLEPLNLDQALRLQSCNDLIREAIWKTKWKFALKELILKPIPLQSILSETYGKAKTILTRARTHVMALIWAWLPHVRHFVHDLNDQIMFITIFLSVLTDSPRLFRLEIQTIGKNNSLYVRYLYEYAVGFLKEKGRDALFVPELVTSYNDTKIHSNKQVLEDTRETLQGWISLIGWPYLLTRLEWPRLFRGIQVEKPIHLPNLQSLTVIYDDLTADCARAFIEKNRSVVELDVLWMQSNSSTVSNFFNHFLAPIRSKLCKLRLTFQWRFMGNKRYAPIAIEPLYQVSSWPIKSLIHLELGLCDIPCDALNLIATKLTAASHLQTLVFLYTSSIDPIFPIQVSPELSRITLNNVVFDFSRRTQPLMLPESLQYILGDNQGEIKVRNLTFCHVKSGFMFNKLLQVTYNNFRIFSTLQFRGCLNSINFNSKLNNIIHINFKLNQVVLMSTHKMLWPNSVFKIMQDKGKQMEHYQELRLNGALFYFDYQQVSDQSLPYMYQQLSNFDSSLHYFRFH